jgi:ABC-type transporter Mla maintaining outer membrane lipid asymmetry ATPase subunit MlaF
VRDGKVRRPLKGTGFGQPDIGSFVLRPTLWSLEKPRKRPVFLYDEPMRCLNDPTHRLHEKASEMIQRLSKELGIQIIMITQLPELAECANKTFLIEQKNFKSYVKEINEK